MVDVARGQQCPSPDRRHRFPDEHAVHDDAPASGKVFRGKLVFRRNVRFQNVGLGIKGNLFPPAQVGQRDQPVIFRIEFEHLVPHFTRSAFSFFASACSHRLAFPLHCRTRRGVSRVLDSPALSISRAWPHSPPARHLVLPPRTCRGNPSLCPSPANTEPPPCTPANPSRSSTGSDRSIRTPRPDTAACSPASRPASLLP